MPEKKRPAATCPKTVHFIVGRTGQRKAKVFHCLREAGHRGPCKFAEMTKPPSQ